MDGLNALAKTLLETLRDLAPILAIIVGFQWAVLRQPIAHPRKVFVGFVYVLIGIALFLEGLEMALFPLGELMAKQLADPGFLGISPSAPAVLWSDYLWVYLFAVCLGFASSLAEPSVIAVALKAQEISGGAINAWGLRLAVAVGVAVGLGLGTFRIVTGGSLVAYIFAGYVLVLIQTAFAPRIIIGLAYDSGGVTTSTITVPLVAALGLGLASSVPGRDPVVDGFGLIAFACLFPILAILTYARIADWLGRRRAAHQSEAK